LARVGHKVLTLKRVAVGPVKLGDLLLGGWRRLMPAEVQSLLDVAKEKRRDAKRKQRGQGPGARDQRAGGRSPGLGVGDESHAEKYVQKQALLAEPLSLDDLLRDDLDEGPLTPADMAVSSVADASPAEATRGEVIGYEEELSSPPPTEG